MNFFIHKIYHWAPTYTIFQIMQKIVMLSFLQENLRNIIEHIYEIPSLLQTTTSKVI